MSTSKTARKARPVARSIPLKTVHDDILKANKNSTLTTKKMRVKLRAAMKASHTHNETWTFTPAEYVKVRSMFDPAYAKAQSKPARVKKDKAPVAPEPAPAE